MSTNEPSTLTVLAVDDDPVDLEILNHHLEDIREWAVKVTTFNNPDDALDWLKESTVDLILLDYFMGARSGLEVFSEIRSAGYNYPVIFLTGNGDESVAVEAMKAGVADYLSKDSLSGATLNRAVSNAVEKHRLQVEVEQQRLEVEAVNQDLRRKNKEIQSFYHTLSHELKTPLTSIREFISIVMDGLAGPTSDKQFEYMGYARNSCDLICRYLDDILDVSRIETGKLCIRPGPVSMDRIVKQVESSVSGIADRKGIRLEVEIPNNIPRVYADENRIIQVLTNLVNNALKFTPAGGEVGIQVEYTELLEDKVRVCVRDTGRGIHPRQQRRIFDRHYQARKRDSAEGGMGLGLYLCREIIQMHGDEITVQSDLGTGSTFIFTLTRYCPVLDERELDERDSEVCDLEYLTQ